MGTGAGEGKYRADERGASGEVNGLLVAKPTGMSGARADWHLLFGTTRRGADMGGITLPYTERGLENLRVLVTRARECEGANLVARRLESRRARSNVEINLGGEDIPTASVFNFDKRDFQLRKATNRNG